jgi:hypothetical protein
MLKIKSYKYEIGLYSGYYSTGRYLCTIGQFGDDAVAAVVDKIAGSILRLLTGYPEYGTVRLPGILLPL